MVRSWPCFANSGHKAYYVGMLLDELGCDEVTMETTIGRIPATNIVRFKPTDEIRKALALP